MKSQILIVIFITHFTMYSYAQSWEPVGGGTNAEVRALCVFNDELYAGGNFITAGGVPANLVAKWDGVNWHNLGNGPNFNGVYSLHVFNNELYAGGALGVEKWNGTNWSPVGALGDHAYDLETYNNELYVGCGGSVRKWNNSTWVSVGNGLSVNDLCIYKSQLIATGSFLDISGVPYNNIAKWNGNNWSSIGYGILNGFGWAVSSYNGELYLAGSFSTSQGNAGEGFMKWNDSTWTAITPNVYGILSLDSINGQLYAGGGSFDTCNFIAVYNGNWSGLGNGMNNKVKSVVNYRGELFAAGEFTMASGKLVFYIAKWGALETNVETVWQHSDSYNNVYPNPFTTKINLVTKGKQKTIVYNMAGKIVFDDVVSQNRNEIDLSFLASGIYVLQINTDEGNSFFKIVKQNIY